MTWSPPPFLPCPGGTDKANLGVFLLGGLKGYSRIPESRGDLQNPPLYYILRWDIPKAKPINRRESTYNHVHTPQDQWSWVPGGRKYP